MAKYSNILFDDYSGNHLPCIMYSGSFKNCFCLQGKLFELPLRRSTVHKHVAVACSTAAEGTDVEICRRVARN